MRQVTKNSVDCLLSGGNKQFSNTLVQTIGNISKMYLFGNLIAIFDHSTNKLEIRNACWPSNTTKERLNGLPNVKIRQHKWEWYLNGALWDGNLIEVKQHTRLTRSTTDNINVRTTKEYIIELNEEYIADKIIYETIYGIIEICDVS